MRLQGQSKLGYYPTPERTRELLPTWLSLPGDGPRRYLDPCCGEGHALAALAAHAGPAETFGIELSQPRAEAARQRLDHVLAAGYEMAVLTDETFSLALLNPPYDGQNETGSGTRLEETFLLATTPRLVAGGVLVYLIPHARVTEKVARHLAGWYTALQAFRLPAGEYETFRQVAIFGLRRAEYQTPSGDALRAVMAWAGAQQIAGYTEKTETDAEGKVVRSREPLLSPLPELHEGHGDYPVPPSPARGNGGVPFRFQFQPVADEDFLRVGEGAAARLEASREWRDLIPVLEPQPITPAMTPKKGHIALQVSGGLLGTNVVRTASGGMLLLKGGVRKYTVARHGDLEIEPDGDDDKPRLRKVEVEERFETLLSTLDESGALTTHTDPAAIGRLLETYVGQLAEIVQARNVPQYDLRPEAWEWSVFEPLSRGRTLPGRDETGLTEFQKHLAVALGRLCLKHGAGIMTAEMASGKTSISLAIAEYLREAHERRTAPRSPYPVLVAGPGIVTGSENWPKEIREVIPGAEGRVVTMGAKPLPKAMKIGEWLGTLGVSLDGDALEGKDANACLEAIERAASRDEAPISVRELSALRQSLRRTEKSPPNRRKGARAPNLLDGRIGGYPWLGLDVPRDANHAREVPGGTSLAEFIDDHRRGALPEKSFAILSYETAKLGPGRVPAMAARWIRVRRENDAGEWTETVRVLACPTCGAVVAERYDPESGEPVAPIPVEHAEAWVGLRRRFCQAPPRVFNPQKRRHEPGRWTWDEDLGRRVVRAHDARGRPFACGAPLFENTALRREAAARYVARQARGAFGLLLVDECFPGETSVWTPDRGWLPIRQIRPGDLVYSSLDGKLVSSRVARLLIRKRSGSLVTIHHSGGSLTCTPNHKIYTDRGLVPAGELIEGDTLYGSQDMPGLQQGIPGTPPLRSEQVLLSQLPTSLNEETHRAHLPNLRRHIPNQAIREHLLFKKLCRQVPCPEDSESRLSEGGPYLSRENEEKQSDEQSRCFGQSDCQPTGASICAPGRQWETDRAAEETLVYSGFSLAGGISNYDGGEILEVRQARLSPPGTEDRRRSRWSLPYASQTESDRPQENSDLRKFRVESVEIHQPRGDGEPGICNGDNQLIYNLEVENSHNYFANGILVGNCHKAKSKGTGVGWALAALKSACRWTVGLTGTLFGGQSTSIFWLLYRLTAEVRREFGFNDERRWSEKYGLLKTTFYVDENARVPEDGAFTGARFFETVDEKPGISPAITGLGLKYCTFSSLKDVGLPLPEYGEEIVRLALTPEMRAQYAEVDGSQSHPPQGLLAWALEMQKREDGKGAISVWLSAALNRPDAMFRGEPVWFNRRVSGQGRFAVRRRELVAELDAVAGDGERLPKEVWLVNACRAERERGRKTLVYLRQTGGRDIQPRLTSLLEESGLRAGILRPTLAPEKRAAWLKRHAGEFDVLLCNARLVEVGLNLTMFSTAVFYEMEYSLYITWQAMRRLYRPGAPRPVKLYFPVYAGTLEESALDLIGAKMMAAQIFYGDSVGGALVEEGDEGDLIGDLVRQALGQIDVGRAEGLFGLGQGARVTDSPFGSPTAVSPALVSFAELAARRAELLGSRRARKRPLLAHPGQLDLFG